MKLLKRKPKPPQTAVAALCERRTLEILDETSAVTDRRYNERSVFQSARLRRTVFGVAPNTFVPDHPAQQFTGEKFVSGSRRRDGDDCTRDARAPQETESFRLRTVFIALTCAAALLLTSALNAQTFTLLHIFAPCVENTSSDDRVGPGDLILSGSTLYGTAGGFSGNTTGDFSRIFAVNTDGTGCTTLHSFSRGDDGVDARNLVISGNTIYAVGGGGTGGSGTVFKLNTDGNGFTVLYNFSAPTGQNLAGRPINSDGAWPLTALILSGDTLYGTAGYGGLWGNGTVFALSTDGSSFKTLHNFTADNGTLINADGIFPTALVSSGSNLVRADNLGW